MRAVRAALTALLLTLPAPAAPEEDERPRVTSFAIVDGTIRSIDLDAHAFVLEVGGADETLGLDRNTLVYLPQGLANVAALRPGDEVRAARNGRNVAYWIEVRRGARADRQAASPGEGTGPAGARPPAEASPATRTPPGTAVP